MQLNAEIDGRTNLFCPNSSTLYHVLERFPFDAAGTGEVGGSRQQS
jgi:hypothetical protein